MTIKESKMLILLLYYKKQYDLIKEIVEDFIDSINKFRRICV